jgi:hypothetical protein
MWIHELRRALQHRCVATTTVVTAMVLGASIATTLITRAARRPGHSWIGEDHWGYWPLDTGNQTETPQQED